MIRPELWLKCERCDSEAYISEAAITAAYVPAKYLADLQRLAGPDWQITVDGRVFCRTHGRFPPTGETP